MALERLEGLVRPFLQSFRLGIDLGEAAGGVAIVRGNEIVEAFTFVDFHETTLETRRTLRRGRRTRHAKKMRLARLRSWALRQRLPDGKHLPDPYKVMRDVRFQTMPGLYKTPGKSPLECDTWIERARTGGIDASGFVCALTHLFQKRGYKYDDKELKDYTDGRLEEFLNSCCRLGEAPELKETMRREVEGRKKPKLQKAFEAALTRPAMPRKAVPRQIKEADLRTIIEAFGIKQGLDQEKIARWKSELVGLLNKILREARFDNRIKSTCSWCEKKTPRTGKPEVRKWAFEAAVRNNRIKEQSGNIRAPNHDEVGRFLRWWERREAKEEFNKGRNVDIFDRAPTKENLEKALEKLGAVRSWIRGANGKHELRYPMLPQLSNLLNAKSTSGRANLCVEHLKMAAQGKTMKDAGVDWQTQRIRRAPNPRREQHDARVLKLIERMLFRKGEKGNAAWRYGPLATISIEVPEPGTEQAKPGQALERSELTLKQRLWEETGGRCVYQATAVCKGRNGEVSLQATEKEHIVPRAAGGPDLRNNLVTTCLDCNKAKDNRLPGEWLRYGSDEWRVFETRVKSMSKLPEFKKQLLLSEPGKDFLDDPTPLARVGARWRVFVVDLIKLFKKYGVPEPQILYETGKPLIQRVDGRMTQLLRKSWLYKDKDGRVPNFPEKSRSDLYNHAQDAALIAAVPPHTWRNKIFVEQAVRPCLKRDPSGKPVAKANGSGFETEMRQRPGIALLNMAPDWTGYLARATHPLVIPLGSLKARSSRQLMDLSFYQSPMNRQDKRLQIRKPIENPSDSPGSQRRKTVSKQKGGLVIQVGYFDPAYRVRRQRKVQVKPIQSTAAVFWIDAMGKLQISLERPPLISRIANLPKIDPPIPEDVRPLAQWHRAEMVKLPANKEFSEGFYRVVKIEDSGITVLPERSVTAKIAETMDEDISASKRKIGKTELLAILRAGTWQVESQEPE